MGTSAYLKLPSYNSEGIDHGTFGTQDAEGFLVTNLDGIISDADFTAAALMKARLEFLAGKPLLMFVAQSDRRFFLQHLAELQHSGGSHQFPVHLQTASNMLMSVILNGELSLNAHGKAAIQWRVRDDSRYQSLSEALSKNRAQIHKTKKRLRTLRHRLVMVQESERRFLAHELHDELGQSLTGLKMTLERLSTAPDQPELAQAICTVNRLIEQVRALALDLHPTMLDDLGLLPTLLWHFQQFREHTQISIKFTHNGLTLRFGRRIETVIYRIIQEALTNTARYAQVSEVQVSVCVFGSQIEVMVADQGVGFALELMQGAPHTHGIVSMAERARSVGGRLIVSTAPGLGTSIRVELPRILESECAE